MKKYKCILPSRDNNRLFRELSGYIYIADHSGDTPEDTDDGPLLFDYQNCKEIKLKNRDGVLYAEVPVFSERKQRGGFSTFVDRDAAIRLGSEYNIPVNVF